MRDPIKRLLSRRAYYNRNKERLNKEAREERRVIKEKVEDGLDFVLRVSKMSVEELRKLLSTCRTDERRRVVKGFIRERGG